MVQATLLLPPLEPSIMMAPRVVEEALPSIPEVQSPTLTIHGMLGELGPEEETMEA